MPKLTKTLLIAVTVLVTACGGNVATTNVATTAADPSLAGATVTLIAHDSFALSPGTLAAFTDQTGIEVDLLTVGDTGTLVAQSVLNKDNPLGDVLYGIDNTYLSRALDEGIFVPYRSPALANVNTALALTTDDQYRVTPIDYGYVCVNYWKSAFTDTAPPVSLDDLTKPEYADELVVQHPETSSPGLAFLLATIARYGDDWENYWADLRSNGVSVAADWNSAYYGEFKAGGGSRALVVSYASSPPVEVMFSEPHTDIAPTGVITDGCFRQIEYAGVLEGTDNPAAAQALIDFMLSQKWQADVPANMFVYPVIDDVVLPQVFIDHAAVPDNPLSLSPAEIGANRDSWTQRWVEIVLR